MVTKTTYETKYEYDESGKVIHKVATETVDVPNGCICDDCAPLLEAEGVVAFEDAPSALDIITGAAGLATLAAAICLAVKIVKSK